MKTRLIAGAVVLAAAATLPASAGDLTLKYTGQGPKTGVNYSYTYLNPNTMMMENKTAGTSAGVFNWDVIDDSNSNWSFGPTVKTFCIELTENIGSGNVVTYGEDPGAVNSPEWSPPPYGPEPMGSTRAAMLGDLHARFYGTAVSVVGNSNYAFIGGNYTGNVIAAAFQVSVWEIVHENTADASTLATLKAGLDATAGNFFITNGSGNANTVRLLANDMFAQLLMGGQLSYGLAGLNSASKQGIHPLIGHEFCGRGQKHQ